MHVVSKVCFPLVIGMLLVHCGSAIASDTKIKTGLDLLREGKFAEAHVKLSNELTVEKDTLRRARLLDRLGQVMEHQGKYDKALKLFTQSLDLRKQSRTHKTETENVDSVREADAEDSRSFLNLGRLYLKQGNLQKADGYLNRALSTANNVGLLKGGSIVSESQRYLAELHLLQGNKMEAYNLSNTAASLRRERSKKEAYAQKMAECLTTLARSELAIGSNSKALVAAESAIAIGDPADRKNRVGLADRLETLAEVHIASARGSAANEPANRTWELRKRELGSKHPSVARSLLLCGHSYMQLRDYGRAEKCYRESFELSTITLADKHPQVAAALMSLACVRLAQGRVQESQNDYNRAMSIYASIYGDNHQVVAFHQKLYKDLMWQTEYWQEALSMPISGDSKALRSAANLDGTLLAASIAGVEPPATNNRNMTGKHIVIAVALLCSILLATACVLFVPSLLATLIGNTWKPSDSSSGNTASLTPNLRKRNDYSSIDMTPSTVGKPQAMRSTKEYETISFAPDTSNSGQQSNQSGSGSVESTSTNTGKSSNIGSSRNLGTSKIGKKTQKDFIPRWTAEENNVERW